jgi:hypothetical protein
MCPKQAGGAQRLSQTQRQRQLISRLLPHRFGAMLGMPTNGRHPSAATLWRVTVETWLRCQGLISIRQNQNPKASTNLLENWSHN